MSFSICSKLRHTPKTYSCNCTKRWFYKVLRQGGWINLIFILERPGTLQMANMVKSRETESVTNQGKKTKELSVKNIPGGCSSHTALFILGSSSIRSSSEGKLPHSHLSLSRPAPLPGDVCSSRPLSSSPESFDDNRL
ncbi:hypothetical protein ILYODFUR_018478 [Ilyodon furcidens]|uniref:Uncharacterized protein n=1 Tax=Ilyodon furcidens TaxID=33524 RepID=A0ABV0TXI1_9TELE